MMKDFCEQGFVVWSGVLAAHEVEAFRAECSALYADHKARGRDLLESGCVMDLFRDTQIKDQSPSRTDAKRYIEMRANTVEVSGLRRARWLVEAEERNLLSVCLDLWVLNTPIIWQISNEPPKF